MVPLHGNPPCSICQIPLYVQISKIPIPNSNNTTKTINVKKITTPHPRAHQSKIPREIVYNQKHGTIKSIHGTSTQQMEELDEIKKDN
jgi:hypothetical protein